MYYNLRRTGDSHEICKMLLNRADVTHKDVTASLLSIKDVV